MFSFRHPSLYEFVRNEVSSDERIEIIHHLEHCRRCADEAGDLSALLDTLPSAVQPSEEFSPEYWQRFLLGVERRIQLEAPKRNDLKDGVLTWAARLLIFGRRRVALVTAALAVIVAAIVLWKWPAPAPPNSMPELPVQEQATNEPTGDRVHQYFRKSKILLVGLENMKEEESNSIDLSAERKVSRELVHEARYLQRQPLDPRSERLIGDVQKVFIELAAMKEHPGAPNVQLIRSGIRRENLLYKVRMAENLFDSSLAVPKYY
jgi:hypothetical protein